MARTHSPRGGANPFVIFMLLVAAGVCYWGWVFGPAWYEHEQLKQAVRHAGNVAYSKRSEDAVRDVILTKVRQLKMRNVVIGKDGAAMQRPLPLDEDNIGVVIRRSPPEVTIELEYDRHFVLPLLNRERTVTYTYEKTTDLSEIKW